MTRKDSKLILDVSETMLMLVKSTGNYTVKRIMTQRDRVAYTKSLNMCIEVFEQKLLSLPMIKTKVLGVNAERFHLYKSTLWDDKKTQRNYHTMAVNHTMDIIEKLEVRFITGGGDKAPKIVSNAVVYDSEEVF